MYVCIQNIHTNTHTHTRACIHKCTAWGRAASKCARRGRGRLERSRRQGSTPPPTPVIDLRLRVAATIYSTWVLSVNVLGY
jgi:hypothetical protein